MLEVGTVIGGRLRVDSLLGAGGVVTLYQLVSGRMPFAAPTIRAACAQFRVKLE